MQNLHNHTQFSDGTALPKEIVDEAIKQNMEAVAITDHFQYIRKSKKLELYIEVLQNLKDTTKDIKILKGMEINTSMVIVDELPIDILKQLDFVLLEHLPSVKVLIKMAKAIPCRIGIAHPNSHILEQEALIEVCEKYNIFIELNTIRFTFMDEVNDENQLEFETQESFFNKLKGTKIKVSVGTDTHTDLFDYYTYIKRAYEFIERLELKEIYF